MLNVKGVCSRLLSRITFSSLIIKKYSKKNDKNVTDFCAGVKYFWADFSLCVRLSLHIFEPFLTIHTSCVVRILFLLCGTNFIKDKKERLLTKYTPLTKSSGVRFAFAFTAINTV